MEEDQPQFIGVGPDGNPVDALLENIAGEGLGWTVAVLLALVVGFLFLLLMRKNDAIARLLELQRDVISKIYEEQKTEDRKTIDRLATVIANNTASGNLLAEAVRSLKDKKQQ